MTRHQTDERNGTVDVAETLKHLEAMMPRLKQAADKYARAAELTRIASTRAGPTSQLSELVDTANRDWANVTAEIHEHLARSHRFTL